MAARRPARPPSSMMPAAWAAAVAAIPLGAWLGLPGALGSWAALLAAAYSEPAPELTGPRKAGSGPSPGSPAEERRLRQHQVVARMRLTLLPSGHWVPTKEVAASLVAAVLCAGVAATLPVTQVWMRAAAAVAAFAVVTGVPGARRDVTESPGSTFAALLPLVRSRSGLLRVVLPAVAGLLAGAAVAVFAVAVMRPWKAGPPSPSLVFVALVAALFAGVAALPAWRKAALGGFRELMAERAVWAPRWLDLKVDPAPVVVATREVGGARASVLATSGGRSASELMGMAAKLAPYAGGNVGFAMLPVEDENENGPVSGTVHRTKVEAVSWPNDSWPDVGDPSTDPDTALLAVRYAMSSTMSAMGLTPAVAVSVDPLHASDSERAAWRVSLAWPLGGEASLIRLGGGGPSAMVGSMLGDAVLDHREGFGVLYVGDLGAGIEDDDLAERVSLLAVEDDWNAWWGGALKSDVNPPVIRHEMTSRAELSGGASVDRFVFAVRIGHDPTTLTTPATERALNSSVGNSSLLTISAFSTNVGSRAGERHGQVVVVYRSTGRVPATVMQLAPAGRSEAPRWYLIAAVNHAFDHCRMARPEIVAASALTSPQSRRHIWEVRLRLYGGVAFADVRAQGERLRQALGADWLRVADAEDGCTIFVGSRPSSVELANPRRDSDRLVALDWDQAFVDAKVSGAGGLVPRMVGSATMPANDRISVLDFDLPPGVDIAGLRAAVPKLRTNTGNAYVEVRATAVATRVQVVCAETDPMPWPAPFDYEAARSSPRGMWPFGVAVDGTPMVWNVKELPHLLVAGASGGGKTVQVMSLLTAMAVKPADETEFYIIDIQKKGADYRFMSDYLIGAAWTAREAAALIRAVYAKGQERINRNAELGVGNVSEWPEGPPPQIILVIDEFTSLITTEVVSRTGFDDPELEAARLGVVADNAYRVTIGQYTGKIARELRSAGVTLILATQQLKQDSLKAVPGGDTLKSSLNRMLLGRASFGERSSALKQPSEAAELGESVPRGRGLFEGERYAEPFQGWFEADTSRLTAAIAAARAPVSSVIDLAPFLAPEVKSGPAIVEVSADEWMPQEEIDLGEIEFSLDDLDDLEVPVAQGERPQPTDEPVVSPGDWSEPAALDPVPEDDWPDDWGAPAAFDSAAGAGQGEPARLTPVRADDWGAWD